MKKIILTGGGTAGHVTPNLALIPKLRDEGWEIHYIGTESGIEKRLIAAVPGVVYHSVPSGKLRRYFSLQNLTDPFKVAAGAVKSANLVRKIKPDVVFSKGGFVSVPVVYGAGVNRVPVIVHESDMSPGLSNRLATPIAKAVLCAFPEAAKLAGKKGVYAGTPLRPEILRGSREKGLARFGFNGSRPVLMVVGGSSGATAINAAVRAALPKLLECFHVLHLCGQGHLDSSLTGQPGYVQVEYLNDEMADAYAAADLLISRAGANTLCEILALRKPSLLIPYPATASRGDQLQNAKSFAERGLCKVLQQENMTAESLTAAVVETYKQRGELISAMEIEGRQSDGLANALAAIHKYAK